MSEKITREMLETAAAKMRASGIVGPYACFAPKESRDLVEACGFTYLGNDASEALTEYAGCDAMDDQPDSDEAIDDAR